MDIPSTQLSKPSVPYIKGSNFTVRSHIPPPPTVVTKGCCRNFNTDREERRRLSPVERCLQNPPLLGAEGHRSLNLEIIESLKVGDGHNAQVFIVHVPKPEITASPTHIVAKLYDPFYFDDDEGYLNPFLCVDKHYTHEVHAYEVLSDLQGTLIPRFHGSYSLEIPVEESAKRSVRMILMEYIPGLSMQQTTPQTFTQQTRQQLMKSIIDFESDVYKRDILLTDLCPRNVMLVDQSGEQKLIRYNSGTSNVDMFLGQYISPLLRWKEYRMREFRGWVDCEWDSWVKEVYGHEDAGITAEMRERFC
ncbi:hypothetical protein BO71DRAFT_470648 [Aspergillus ellipticus CBS 707.79]|uniref:Protein kinase domain-containing protein n=1 Tax=Aspergillus ellipticus CBS 707.79 TaxID=1448320 RepID=A0A319CZB4_9EURO|nr:hypothetical protein BO71DRAFT_470648 [Aspergillus ellipticus CBS 707.79]